MTMSRATERSELYREHVATLVQRYTAALEHCGADRALVFAGIPTYRDRDDQTFPYVADPYFQQWIPLRDAPGSIIEVRPGRKPHLIVAHDEDFWHAPARLPGNDVLDQFEVTRTSRASVAKCLAKPAGRTLVIGELSCARDEHRIVDSPDFLARLDFDRAIKTPWEIDRISVANARSAAGHRAVEQKLKPGVSEFELHVSYCLAAGQTDADLPYSSIIGLNEHAAILHYQQRDSVAPPKTRSLLIDAGARVDGYASDITRTYSVGEPEFAALIEAMNGLQQELCNRAIAGMDFVALNESCHQLLAGVLAEFEFIACSPESAFDNGATTAFLPHGLGHLLGVQVHDVGGHMIDHEGTAKPPPERHPWLRLTRMLEEDMVVTIEPGIYYIEPLITAFDRGTPGIIRRSALEMLARCGGIRIEDNVQVKSRGHSNLTRIAFGE